MMTDGITVMIGEDGVAREYDDTYDVIIHCESQKDQDEVKRRLKAPQGWIPIIGNQSTPMPKEHKVYLVTYKTLHGRRYVRDLETSYVGSTPRYIGWSKKVNGEVIAWMPLPTPYKGGDQDERKS